MRKVLLLGGTGAMGVYLSRDLVARGYDVLVTTRHPLEDHGGVRFIQGNAREDSFIQKVLSVESPDAVVDFMAYGTDEFRRRHRMLLSGTGHYLFLSSYRVFAEDQPLTEDSPRLLEAITNDPDYLATDEYGLSKARQEDILRNSGFGNWTILRPSITFSRNRFQFGCLEANVVCFRALQGVPVVMPREMLEKRTTLTWGYDAARMISLLVLNSRSKGEDFNVVTSESHTWRDVAKIYHEEIGLEVCEVSLEDYCRLCNPYQVKYDRMFDRMMDNRKVLGVTGMDEGEMTSLKVALHNELTDFRTCPVFTHTRYSIFQNVACDRLCAVHCDLSRLDWSNRLWYYRYSNHGVDCFFRICELPQRVVGKVLRLAKGTY